MKKRYIFLVIAAIALIVISGCTFEKEEKLTDAVRFKNEYEALNGQKIGETELVNRVVNIPEDNPFVYATAADILTKMDNGESFVVYFGFPSCPWCRSVLPTMIDVAKDYKLDKIYYVDVKDIRNVLEVNEDGKIVTKKEGSEGYIGLVKRFDKVLEDYTLEVEGEEIETGEKRIYAPNLVAVINGVPTELETGISDEQENAFQELTEKMKQETYDEFKCVIKCIADTKSSCSVDKGC